MPQMSPLMWIFLFPLILTLYFVFCIFIYFNFINLSEGGSSLSWLKTNYIFMW
uniref:ATP synthase F0 subunit 8 n=1 Tax=Halicryptus spinulosus TaxID=160677 RepID=F8RJA8_9BILA|nr:ATP synthase F0 subunit 8 [Halicryptus spinulosus]ADK97590.1 ATP synthase F0 subunit 8 [Halicryptus spinulosus]CBK55556.1 ATPase subunit 8 [Halicryptus spinulosus]